MLREKLFDLFKSYIYEAIDSFSDVMNDISSGDWESKFENYKSQREKKKKDYYDDFESKYQRYKEYYNNAGSYGNNSGSGYGSQHASDEDQKYYDYLEVPYGSDFETIKKAYKQQMKKYHPDKFYDNEKKRAAAEKVCLKLNEAFQYFSKKHKK